MKNWRKAQEGLIQGDVFAFEGKTFKMVRDTSLNCTYPVAVVKVGVYTATPDTTTTGKTTYSFPRTCPLAGAIKQS